MAVTPNEISNKEFKKVFRGYDADEVEDFLESIVEDYDKIYKENITLKEKITLLNEKIEHYANMESTLQSTLLLAQSAADQAKENSKKEADLIIKDAQDTANSIVRKAEEKAMDVNKEFEMLKQQFNMFKSSFKALLEAQLESVDKTDIGANIVK